MIVGRSPRNPVIGDTVLLRAESRQGIGTIVRMSRVSWNLGGGPVSVRLRSFRHCA
jgi:hypothetical protein